MLCRSLLNALIRMHSRLTYCYGFSFSFLVQLQIGPFYKKEDDCESIWTFLTHLSFTRIDWTFFFSHMSDDFSFSMESPLSPDFWNRVVDAYASSTRSVNVSPGVLPWSKNIFRSSIAALSWTYDHSPEIAITLQFRVSHSGSRISIVPLSRLTQRNQILILQLRIGTCRRLLGWHLAL